ncbi:amidohydrolase family protein [Aspergillus novofumigatus IBT 16806]|uniref:Metallo-dependent hydrolase n=1 Tax=Aspergillus novofumigatus (strain IBT 16806) TaxID=1392255 RepID=A0A2I1BT72_ASPN1|nr:Metallo-dependent hydrolase [Aspergillus novofumigatus IBT 16806]PKX88617.1 Metallo-dependent hydrolase [Aspergillus novofumigatus IBT 16806]
MLYTHATIITVDVARHIIEDGAIYVDKDTIADIGKTDCLLPRYPLERQYSLNGCIVIPGLVSTHIHTVQAILRGTADGLHKEAWLSEQIQPLQNSMTEGEARASVKLAVAEMLKSGTTCFLECLFFPRHGFDGLCQTVQDSGIRACLGRISVEGHLPGGQIPPGDGMLPESLKSWQKWNGVANDRIRLSTAAHSYGIPVTMHLAESKGDADYFSSLGHTAGSYAQAVGLLSPSTVFAHAVYINETSDVPLLSSSGVHISHCPTSNSKFASGICPVPDLLAAGLNVSLGTDGDACNNTSDMFQEMRWTAMVHNTPGDAARITAETVLEMATINGAKALGLHHLIGSLEIGKRADFVALNVQKTTLQPCVNPVSNVVYAATGRDVHVVVVDGRIVVEGGKLLTMDEEEIINAANQAIGGLLQRTGLQDKVKSYWPTR